MDSTPAVDENFHIQELRKQLRILQKKLDRSEVNRASLEGDNERKEFFLKKTIHELENSQQALQRKSHELEKTLEDLQKMQVILEEAIEVADSANQAKSDFLANMSHEFRTPLNGILGYAQILSRSSALPEKERHGINVIHQCGSHLLTLINDVLDLSSIEARKLSLTPQSLHFPSFLQGVVEICRVRSDAKSLNFIYEPDQNLPSKIIADEKRLRQVLLNLLGNAIKFTDQGAVGLKVQLIAQSPYPRICFRVTDTGVGIAPNEIEQIFHAFEQVGDRHRQAEGTGLGLAISQNIVQLMGSNIQVQSQLEVGSEFFFELEFPSTVPIAALNQPVETSYQSNNTHIIGYQGSPRHILIVDDHTENRSILLDLLQPLGFICTEATNGQAGLEEARDKIPDLIITDLVMPVMNGTELLRELRQDPALRHLPVIVFSASVDHCDRQHSLEAGGNDFLAKPVMVNTLFSLLAKHLQLTWNYDETKSESLAETAPELILPPAEDLQLLLEMAQDGLLKKLVTKADQLSQVDDRYQPFTERLVSLAKQFQPDKLETLLQQYLINLDN